MTFRLYRHNYYLIKGFHSVYSSDKYWVSVRGTALGAGDSEWTNNHPALRVQLTREQTINILRGMLWKTVRQRRGLSVRLGLLKRWRRSTVLWVKGWREQGRQIHGDARASLAHQRKQNAETTGPDEDTKTWVGPPCTGPCKGFSLYLNAIRCYWRI